MQCFLQHCVCCIKTVNRVSYPNRNAFGSLGDVHIACCMVYVSILESHFLLMVALIQYTLSMNRAENMKHSTCIGCVTVIGSRMDVWVCLYVRFESLSK